MSQNYSYFAHKECEYFPCHKGADPENFNCLFCYCPLYALGRNCGGAVQYKENGIGLGGVVTFKNARHSVEVAKTIPLDRLLTETDAPYMAPVPFRGKRCDSSMIPYDAAKIAEARGITAQEVLETACENACRLFGITLPSAAK